MKLTVLSNTLSDRNDSYFDSDLLWPLSWSKTFNVQYYAIGSKPMKSIYICLPFKGDAWRLEEAKEKILTFITIMRDIY